MSLYREAVHQHKLFQEFEKLGDFENITAAEINQLREIVLATADQVEPHMDRIQHTFRQYTKHDLQHLLNIADHIYDFLPRKEHDTAEAVSINALELTYLWLAILLHDVGMFVSETSEKQRILDSDEFVDFMRHNREREEAASMAEQGGHSVTASAIHDALFAEFIRRRHAERVHGYIDQHLKYSDNNGNAKALLRFRETDLSSDIGKLCESHNWGVRQSRDSRHPEKCISKLELRDLVGRTPVNMAFIACCLRLGDILDFDRSRTPLSAFHSIHFTETISVEEWNKHLSIKGVEVTQHRVNYVAECETPADYVAVQHFLGWVDHELQECVRIVREFPREQAERYQLDLSPVVDRTQIRMKDPRYVAGGFRFQLEYDQIIRLLTMDKSLYPDETMFLRELLQNALDACRYQKARAQDAGMGDKYIPRIQVWDGSNATRDPNKPNKGPRIVFQDNGVGMSRHQVENFFMRVGKSFYRSAEFNAERERLQEKGIHLDACSRFGIGFLSCFLGGDRIEVETYQYGSDPLKITIEGPRKYFLIERLASSDTGIPFNSPQDPSDDFPPHGAGTKVTVFLREDWHRSTSGSNSDIAFATLDSFAVNQEITISVTEINSQSLRELASRRWDAGPAINIPWAHEKIHRISEEWLIPLSFPLSKYDDSLKGFGAFWFLLSDGKAVPRKGDFFFSYTNRLQVNRLSIYTVPFVSAVRSMCRVFGCATQDEIGLLTNALLKLYERPNDYADIFEELPDFINPSEDEYFSEYEFSDLLGGDLNWTINVIKELGSIDGCEWRGRRFNDEMDAILSKDRQKLIELWKAHGVSSNHCVELRCNYRLALFGIESPGGFQTWNAAAGSAVRHEWLPGGLSVCIDAYGDLAPEPASSRLFVPYDRSDKVRGVVTRAFILQATEILDANQNSEDWENWYVSFISSFDLHELIHSLEESDLRALFANVVNKSGLTKARKRFASVLAAQHSRFGRHLFTRINSKMTVSQADIVAAAKKSNLPTNQIDESVQSLSAHLGWDVKQQ